MRHYLFFDEKQEKKIFRRNVSCIFCVFSMMMWFIAYAFMEKNVILAFVLLLSGLFFFPGVPIILKYYMKAYYIELMDECVVCAGKPTNIFGKARVMYEEVYYIEIGRREPVIFPRGTTPEQMVKEFGGFVNVYDKNREYLFSFRANSLIMKTLKEKKSNIQIIERLNNILVSDRL